MKTKGSGKRNRIISLVLALVLIAGAIPANIFGVSVFAETPTATFQIVNSGTYIGYDEENPVEVTIKLGDEEAKTYPAQKRGIVDTEYPVESRTDATVSFKIGKKEYRASFSYMADKTLAIYDIAKKEDFLTVVSPEEIVNVAALFSVDRLQSSEYVFANGTSVEDIEDAIPSQATLTVTDGETRFADIVWDMDSVNYDPKQKEEQSFRVNGVIELPDDIKNINNSALNVRVNVVVGAVFAEMQKISVSPAKTTVDYGKSVKFTAKAAEAEAYQWAKDDGEGNFGLIEGATTSVYTIKNAKGSDAGSYKCLVTFKDKSQAWSEKAAELIVNKIRLAPAVSVSYTDEKIDVFVSGVPNDAVGSLDITLGYRDGYRSPSKNVSGKNKASFPIVNGISDYTVVVTLAENEKYEAAEVVRNMSTENKNYTDVNFVCSDGEKNYSGGTFALKKALTLRISAVDADGKTVSSNEYYSIKSVTDIRGNNVAVKDFEKYIEYDFSLAEQKRPTITLIRPCSVIVAAKMGETEDYNETAEQTMTLDAQKVNGTVSFEKGGAVKETFGVNNNTYTNPIVLPEGSSGAISYTLTGDEGAKIDGTGKVSFTKTGVYTVTVNVAADDYYNAMHASYTLTVEKGVRDNFKFNKDNFVFYYGITEFNNEPTLGDNPVDGVTYALEKLDGDKVIATIAEDTGKLTFVSGVTSGKIKVTATLPGGDLYEDASCSYELELAQYEIQEEYEILGSKDEDCDWYTSDIVVEANNGYKLCATNDLHFNEVDASVPNADEATFKEGKKFRSVTISTQGSDNKLSFYLIREGSDENGGHDMISTLFKIEPSDLMIDKTDPEVSLTFEFEEWYSSILNAVTFNKAVKVLKPHISFKIDASDAVSGIREDGINWKLIQVDPGTGEDVKENGTVKVLCEGNVASGTNVTLDQQIGSYGDVFGRIQYSATDNAGRIKTVIPEDIIAIDHTPPAEGDLTVSYGAGNPNADNTVTYYGAEGVELNLSATGSISGFKGIRWIFKSASEGETVLKEGDATFDAGQLGKDAVYEKTIRVAADPGERLDGFLTFVLIDGAGNPSEEIAKGPHIVIDNAVPVVTPDYEGSFAMYADPQGTQTAASVEDAKLITYKETNRSFKLFINDPSFSLDRTPVVKKAYSTETVASEYVDISSEVVWTQDGNGGFVAEIPLGGDGSYSYTVECTDLADNTQTYTTPEIVVDTVNPAVSVVTKGETDGMAANSSYYRCPVLATVNVWVKQARVFDANKISISAFSALNAAGNNVNVEGIDKDSFDSDLKNAEWVRTGDAVSGYTFSTTLTLTEEAKYSFTVEAKTIENSGESGQFENYPYGTKKLTSTVIVDKTPPKVDEITYSNNFINKVLNVITFGYYNSDVTVTVEISDEISGIEKATVRYHKAENASTLNVGRKEEKYVLAQEEKGAPNYTCTITLNADDGSYDGFINVTAVDMAHNTTDKKNDAGEVETYTDTENRIVVDNIAPGLEVSRKGGKTVNKETLEEITNVVTDNDAILIFNRDKVSYTIKIDEINFSGDITNDNDSFQNEDINDHGNVKDPDGGRLDLGCELALYKVGEDENPFKTIDPFWTGTSKSVYKTTVNLLNGEVYQGEDDDNNGNYYLADGEYYLKLVYNDRAENGKVEFKSPVIVTDNSTPSAEIILPKAKPVDEVRYYQDEITAEIVVTAKYFCAKDYTVEFTKGPCDLTGNKVGTNSEVTAFKNRNIEWRHDEAAGTYTAKVKFSADARYAFSFVCRNTAGTETQKSSGEFVVDKSAPEITNLEYSPKAPVSALVEALTFGYYKTPVTVKVTVSDVTSGEEGEKYAVSGADRVKLTYVNNGTTFTETLERAAGAAPSANYVFSYELPDIRENYPAATQYDTAFTAVAYDVAENPSDERNEGTTEGAQYNRVIVDTIAPNISVETTAEKVVDEDSLAAVPEEYVYNENDKLLLVAKNQVVLKFTVNEANFYSDDINNGVELTNNEGGAVDLGCKFVLHNLISGDETPLNQTWTKSGDIYTTEVVVSQEKYGDGDYQVELFYKDRSGNDMVFTADRYGNMRADKSYLSQKIVIDSTAPMINVAFDPNDATANEKFFRVTDRTATVRVTERYFAPGDFTFNYTAQKIKEDISVTVDGAGAYNDYGSNNQTPVEVLNDGKETKVFENTLHFTEDAWYNFTIRLTDIAGNVAETYEAPEFVIDDTAPTGIEIEYSQDFKTIVAGALTFRYYNPSVDVTFKGSDETAGIKEFKWVYTKADDASSAVNMPEETGTVPVQPISNDRDKLSKDVSETITLTAGPGTGADQYRGNIRVTAIDRATNESGTEDTETIIVVDRISPDITVETTAERVVYENSLSDVPGNYINSSADKLLLVAKEEVVLKFTVNEANFYFADINNGVELTNNEGAIYDLGCKFILHNLITGDETQLDKTWTKGEGDTYTTTVEVSNEGDYQVEFFYKDRSLNDMDFTPDRYGNTSADKSYLSQKIVIDRTRPTINVGFDPSNPTANEKFFQVADRTATVQVTERYFAPVDFIFNYTAQDINGDIDVTVGGEDVYANYGSNNQTPTDVLDDDKGTKVFEHTLHFTEDAWYNFSIRLTDIAGNEAVPYQAPEFVIDDTGPTIDISYSQDLIHTIIGSVTFRYYNPSVDVTFSGTDKTSGIKTISWSYTKERDSSAVNKDDESGEITITPVSNKREDLRQSVSETITLTAGPGTDADQYRGNIKVTAEDRATNKNIKDDTGKTTIVVDRISPDITVETTAERVVYENSLSDVPGNYINSSADKLLLVAKNQVVLKFTVNEANFYSDDINNHAVLMNGSNVTVDLGCKFILHDLNSSGDASKTQLNQTWTKGEGDTYTTTVEVSKEGDYQVEFFYKDRSLNDMDFTADRYGNMSADKSYLSQKIVIDRTAPTINVPEVEYVPLNATAGDKFFSVAERTATVTVTERYFAPRDFSYQQTAQDINGSIPVTVRGSEVYANYGSNTQTPAAVLNDGKGTKQFVNTLHFTDDAWYNFSIRLTDIAGNEAVPYQAPEFVIDDTAPTGIDIEYSQALKTIVAGALTFLYYNPSVNVTFKGTDETAGIETFEWWYNQEKDTSIVNKLEEHSKISIDPPASRSTAREALTKQVSRTITLTAGPGQGSDQYRGFIKVTATDRATNSSGKDDTGKNVIVVDTKAPKRTVTFIPADQVVTATDYNTLPDFNDWTREGSAEKYYYKEAGNFTISITEANFDSNFVKIFDHETPITAVTWTKGTNQDEWLGTGTFSEEGHHVLRITYTDHSGNKMDDYTSNEITVDKTDPTINVTYSPAELITEYGGRKYYSAKQKATIKITEHNFRASDVVVTVKAADIAEATVAVDDFVNFVKNPSNWTTDGDVHTCEVNYSTDAIYSFDIEYTDLAKRQTADYAEDHFVVDTKAPSAPTISYSTEVQNVILSGVTFNFYKAPVTVTLESTDDIAGVTEFTYSYLNSPGVSSVNAQAADQKISESSITYSNGNKTATAHFTIPQSALGPNNQFRGTVQASAKDRSNNVSETTKETKTLVVDNITPAANITLSSPVSNVGGVNYYAGDITATIEITEANFFPEDVVVLVNGAATKPSGWTQSGDKWTAHVVISQDGDYVITVRYTDKSTNKMVDFDSEPMTIDRTMPTVVVDGIRHESANNDEQIGFTITAKDTNFSQEGFKPELSAVLRDENGQFHVQQIQVGQFTDSTGSGSTYIVDNLEEDAIYTLRCTVEDRSGNKTSMMTVTESGSIESEVVMFSVNRDGSTFMLGEPTQELVDKYYTKKVESNVEITEVNVDPLKEYGVTLNNDELVEGEAFTVTQSGGGTSWNAYTYSVNTENFEKENEYKVVVSSVDSTDSSAYSDIKHAAVNFVVDQTAPVVTVSGAVRNGQYRTDKQKVILQPTDHGGKLESIKITLFGKGDKEGFVDTKLSGDEFLDALDNNNGQLEVTLTEGVGQKILIECKDKAGNTYSSGDDYSDIDISTSRIVLLWANEIFRYGVIGGVSAAILAVGLLIFLKKKKEKDAQKAKANADGAPDSGAAPDAGATPNA